jgi:hypothetical protein
VFGKIVMLIDYSVDRSSDLGLAPSCSARPPFMVRELSSRTVLSSSVHPEPVEGSIKV